MILPVSAIQSRDTLAVAMDANSAYERQPMTSSYDYPAIAKMIDHSLLQPFLSTSELEAGCHLL